MQPVGFRPQTGVPTLKRHPLQQHAVSFFAHTEAGTGCELPRIMKDEFDVFLECGILAHGFLGRRCAVRPRQAGLQLQAARVLPIVDTPSGTATFLRGRNARSHALDAR